jgi:thiol-disulfide isomerase/thioredoxin
MNTSRTKNIILAIILVAVVAVIVVIEVTKPKHLSSSDAANIVVPTTATAEPKASAVPDRAAIQAQEAKQYSLGKELVGIAGYINTQPFTLSSLAAKNDVVLVDFWTYSCINCQRTIPYLSAWYQKYKDQGFVIVGVSAPEFNFEKNYANVAAAVKQFGILYPVVLDNDMQTWDAYNNEYWPADYLINNDGFVVHTNFGEGDYAATEQAIQAALKARDAELGLPDTVPTGLVNPSNAIAVNGGDVQSPETYFGSNRNEYLANGKQGSAGVQTLSVPNSIEPNQLYLNGTWNFQPEFAENTSSAAKIVFQYNAKNVYMVASSANGVRAKVLIDGKPIDPSMAGSDVSSDGTVLIQADRLYNIVQGTSYGPHTLELDVEGPGLDAYTFTFG